MEDIKARIAAIDWQLAAASMNDKGFAVVDELLSAGQCESLIRDYDKNDTYRKTVVMERYRFGLGEYKYFNYSLPSLIQTIREDIYTGLAPIANGWMKMLGIDRTFPNSFTELQRRCHSHNQTKPTVLILKYGKGVHNTLHQDLYGEIFFPIQVVLFLNNPEKDYSGGEFVLLQQTPRTQSKAIVLRPKQGDMLMFTTNFRPAKGSKGYYRVNMRHGVSEVTGGQRHTLGIIFHDALS